MLASRCRVSSAEVSADRPRQRLYSQCLKSGTCHFNKNNKMDTFLSSGEEELLIQALQFAESPSMVNSLATAKMELREGNDPVQHRRQLHEARNSGTKSYDLDERLDRAPFNGSQMSPGERMAERERRKTSGRDASTSKENGRSKLGPTYIKFERNHCPASGCTESERRPSSRAARPQRKPQVRAQKPASARASFTSMQELQYSSWNDSEVTLKQGSPALNQLPSMLIQNLESRMGVIKVSASRNP